MRIEGKQKTVLATGALVVLLFVLIVTKFSGDPWPPTDSRKDTDADSKRQQTKSDHDKAAEVVRRKRSQLISDLKRELRSGEENRIVTKEHAEFSVPITDRARMAYNLPKEQTTAINTIDYVVLRAPTAEEVAEIEGKIRQTFASKDLLGDENRASAEKELLEHFTQFQKSYKILTATQFLMARDPKNKLIDAVDTDQLMEEDADKGMKLGPAEKYEDVESQVPGKTLKDRYAYLFGVSD